jgi:NADH dehydrogenase [ubiquinone] 1 alpha subcomplex assembly factor 7
MKVLLGGERPLMENSLRSLREGGASHASSSPSPSGLSALQEGDGIEISPLAMAACEDIGRFVTRCQGGAAALLIDYGEDFTQEDSLRGFRRHKQVHILSEVL